MIVGTEWLIDASGCRAEALRDTESLRRVFDCIISELDLQVVGSQTWHAFPTPGGVTGLALLTESHLACHTYPEYQTATFNLYCCRERRSWPWADRLAEMLGAESVKVRVLHRLAPDDCAAAASEQIHRPAELSTPSLSGGEW